VRRENREEQEEKKEGKKETKRVNTGKNKQVYVGTSTERLAVKGKRK
jgi:hypothetical protein